MEASETAIVLPLGVDDPRDLPGDAAPERVVIDNRTGLPDSTIEEAVEDVFVEHASLSGIERTSFQTYAAEGSLLARRRYQTPANVIDEIKLARSLAERDDDVGAVIGEMIAMAFGDGMQNQHEDEASLALFDKIAENADLDMVFMEMYRELLISSSVTTSMLFTREQMSYSLAGSNRRIKKSVAAPLVGVLQAENIRVLGNDIFRTGVLAYLPDNENLRQWLRKFFDPNTEPGVKAQMGREDRASANLFTGRVPQSAIDSDQPLATDLIGGTGDLYYLNPRLVHRSTFPKGSWKYPRPLLTRNFALLEAKRMLNIMDYALLQGGSNFIVVAKKGTDQRPAQKREIEGLQNVVRTASRTGVIVGDHRLSFEILTPKLDELLNKDKRRLIGRKLVQAMLRIPEQAQDQPTRSTTDQTAESKGRVVSADRRIIRRHVESHIYEETVNRNPKLFTDRPGIWLPRIILQGTQAFTDYVLKLRDRGDIPRKWAVEAAGYDFDAAVEQRRREMDAGVDDVLAPAAVPFSSPEMGPQDNGPGRPAGSPDRPPGSPPAKTTPRRTINRNPGETIKAWYEDEFDAVVRMGEITKAILEEYDASRSIGRLTNPERELLDREEDTAAEIARRGSTVFVPVNPAYECREFKAIRLRDGLSMIVGMRRSDGAVVAKLLGFRDPDFTERQAEECALRWGYPIEFPQKNEAEVADVPELPAAPAPVHITLPLPSNDSPDFGPLASAMASAAAAAGADPPEIHLHLDKPDEEDGS